MSSFFTHHHVSAVLGLLLLLLVHTIHTSCAFVVVVPVSSAGNRVSSLVGASYSPIHHHQNQFRRVVNSCKLSAAAASSDNQNDKEDKKRLQIPIKPNGSTEPVIVATNNDKNSASSPRAMFTSSSSSSCKETLDESYLTMPRHSRNDGVNGILEKTESVIRALHLHSLKKQQQQQQKKNNDSTTTSSSPSPPSRQQQRQAKIETAKQAGRGHETVYANNYVDLGKVDTVGFDFDYTIVSYTEDLLELIYDMALQRLVEDRQYPAEMLEIGLRFDPNFSIRGLAVDTKTGWICHLAYTHKVAVAWEGRERVPTPRIYAEYRGKRGMTPTERRKRLKPLNDLFSMSECCLIADTVQFFKDRNIPYNGQNVITDVLSAIGVTHISGDFHRLVANNPAKYFEPTPHLKQVVSNLKNAGKRLIFVSNSPFWYVDAGMKYIFGNDWTKDWNAIIASAGKPTFYTEEARPFREVDIATARPMFKPVERFEPGRVYTEGCLKELTRLMDWSTPATTAYDDEDDDDDDDLVAKFGITSGAVDVAAANVLYIGDSLFADLVDAKREFSWTTAAVVPEVGFELEVQRQSDFVLTQRTVDMLVNALRLLQDELGNAQRTREDVKILNALERLVSKWRDRETAILGNPFGSIFLARYQPSLFAHSLRRYCDLYMPSVSSLRNYSPQHRFYPEPKFRLLAHEIKNSPDCWDLEDIMDCRTFYDDEDDDDDIDDELAV